MLIPKNSAAELVVKLRAEAEQNTLKIEEAKRSYADFIIKAQNDIAKNLETIATLEPVAEWDEIDDLPTEPSAG